MGLAPPGTSRHHSRRNCNKVLTFSQVACTTEDGSYIIQLSNVMMQVATIDQKWLEETFGDGLGLGLGSCNSDGADDVNPSPVEKAKLADPPPPPPLPLPTCFHLSLHPTVNSAAQPSSHREHQHAAPNTSSRAAGARHRCRRGSPSSAAPADSPLQLSPTYGAHPPPRLRHLESGQTQYFKGGLDSDPSWLPAHRLRGGVRE